MLCFLSPDTIVSVVLSNTSNRAGEFSNTMAKAGRKPKGNYASKGATMSARLTVNTRRRLDCAAKASGNSVSEEVERRLIASFDKDEVQTIRSFGHPQTYALLRLAAEAIKQVEEIAGHNR